MVADLGLHAPGTGSARIMRELRTLDTQLSKHWPGYPASRTFHEALAA